MPKKLVGGVFLLCLASLSLAVSEDGETFTTITQPEILEQLINLKSYIPNPNMTKPVWVQLKNYQETESGGETIVTKDEIVVVQGELKKSLLANIFDICVNINGYKLVIQVEFTQAVNDDNEPIDDWYIDTGDAKYLFVTDAQNIGAISELPVFENIVDAQGHKRFIEGDIALSSIDGVAKTYGKWSLSGSHLLIVLCVDIANETALNVSILGTLRELPSWLIGKIVPTFSNAIEYKSFNMFADNLSSQNIGIYLRKPTANSIDIYIASNVNLTADRHCRIAFDLLIDNE